MTRLRADLLLLLTALIWGTAFVAQKVGVDSIGPLGFVAGRFVMSSVLMLPFALRESRSAAVGLKRRDWALAGLIGLILGTASMGQQFALTTTTVTNAGFITSVYIAFVPFVAWLVLGTRPRPLVLAAVAVSLAGAWLLASHGQSAHLAQGDMIVLAGTLLYAGHIVSVSIFQRRAHRPYMLSFTQNAVTAGMSLVMVALFEPVTATSLKTAFPAMAYAGLVSGGLGYTLQILAQRHTPATEAALIMSMESVFAALAGALLLGERLTALGGVGCALILLGVIMVEVLPSLMRPASVAAGEMILGEVPMD